MDAYCQAVRELKDKFDGLELIHIPRWSNEAADTLAKMASKREPVPARIFASDLLKPSIRYGEESLADANAANAGSGAAEPTLANADPHAPAKVTRGHHPESPLANPNPSGEDSGAEKSADPSPDSEVMELNAKLDPALDPADDWRETYI